MGERDQNYSPQVKGTALANSEWVKAIEALFLQLQRTVTQDFQLYHREKLENQLKIERLTK
jgi:hypothetical protein